MQRHRTSRSRTRAPRHAGKPRRRTRGAEQDRFRGDRAGQSHLALSSQPGGAARHAPSVSSESSPPPPAAPNPLHDRSQHTDTQRCQTMAGVREEARSGLQRREVLPGGTISKASFFQEGKSQGHPVRIFLDVQAVNSPNKPPRSANKLDCLRDTLPVPKPLL